MANSARNKTRTPFLPEGVKPVVRRRLVELSGIVLVAAMAALALALLTYHPGDRSLNMSVSGPVENLLGPPGAWLADPLLQAIGLAGLVIIFILAVWGVRIVLRRRLRRLWVRLASLPVAVLLASIALAVVPVPDSWPLESGLGGYTGSMLLSPLADLTGALRGAGPAIIGLIAFTLAAGVGALALGLTRDEWRTVGLVLRQAAILIGQASRWSAINVWAALTLLVAQFPWRGANSTGDRVRVEPKLARSDAKSRPEKPTESKPARAAKVEPRKPSATKGKREDAARQTTMKLAPGDEHQLPPLDLLSLPPAADQTPSKDSLEQNARLLESVLGDYGVRGEIQKVRPGPVVTLYELEPAAGIKSSRVIGLGDDIARSMSAISVRVAVVPGRSVIGIELPNHHRELVALREMLASKDYEESTAALTLALGKDIGGTPMMVDLARLPHLLVAGTTGSGKSVAINTMILSLLFRLSPAQCRFIMIDPKMLELSIYDGIPHLLAPVVTDPNKAVSALRWAVREMENRYRLMSNLSVRNITGYNDRIRAALKAGESLSRTVQTGFDTATGEPIYEEQPLEMAPLPFIVIVVDEMADLMLVAGRDVEAVIQRLAQMARAAGIHLIMATQRPSVDVITGTIKANFPARISFQVTSKIDSRTILGDSGAEQLLGQGDMLYMAPGGRITRVHGPFVSDDEVEAVTRLLKAQQTPDYTEDITVEDTSSSIGPGGPTGGGGEGGDALYDQAVALVCRERKASTSFVQRHLQIGYNRAARIIDQMEAEGVISSANHVGKREVLARDIEDRES